MAFMMQAVKQFGTVSAQSLALQVQDEAYTFAYYLLGDEKAAEAATQAAFSAMPRRDSFQAEQFRKDVLRGVLTGSQRFTKIVPSTGPAAMREDLIRALLQLPAAERSALVLVDVLGQDYNLAASVMGCSRKQFTHLLAQGRMKFAHAGQVQ